MKVLMVCLGNICRSPLAEGVLRNKTKEFDMPWIVESAGTSSYHVGAAPDSRSILVASKHGIDISSQKSRQISVEDFYDFDLILAMDSSNYMDIMRLKPQHAQVEIELIMNYYAPGKNLNVPDPYYREGGFDDVFEMLDTACEALINK